MTSINQIIQGPEDKLFDRVYNELSFAGASQRCLRDFEACRRQGADKIIAIAEVLLTEFGYWK